MSKFVACLCTIMLAVSGVAFAVGGEDIATATVIPVLPFSDTGDTTTYLNDYDVSGVFTCPYTSTAPDVVYAYTPAVDAMVDIDLGASLYDTKLFVYENTTATVVGCDDDNYANYTSAIFDLALTGGNTYYVVVAGYGTSVGSYDIQMVEVLPPGDPVNFVGVDSQGVAGLVSYTATLVGGYTLGSIDWTGFAVPINTGSYGSELWLDISGPLGSASFALGSGTTYVGGATMIGSSAAFGGAGDPAGVWTFDFRESYDDGSDALPDGTWDNIDFWFGEAIDCFGPDTCADALLIGPGTYAGDTTNCTDGFTSYDIFSWTLEGNDHVYAINAACEGTEICVTMTPLDGQDPGIALAVACTDGSVIAINGADNGLAGDAESFCHVVAAGEEGDLYIFLDSYGLGSAGAYTLDVTVTSPVVNDTCAGAIDVTGGGLFSGTTECAINDYDGASCTGYSSAAPDAVYVIDLNDGDTLDMVYTPFNGQDLSFYVVGDCGDIVGTCVVGADNTVSGDELITHTFDCAGTYYIICDAYGSGEGAFDLSVVVTPAAPVDTFDVAMTCDAGPHVLPTQTLISVSVTNTYTAMRNYCGDVGVTLCNGRYIGNVRAGNMVLAAGETQSIGWGQVIPAYAATCDCTLAFITNAYDCTPCADAGAAPAGWAETATCGITTVCP